MAALSSLAAGPADSGETPYAWNLPKGFPQPYVPAGNPMTESKVELGRHLFYDKRLSVNGTQSCATCHRQELAFTDGRAVSLGATGQPHSRSAMSLVNVAYSGALTWSNPRMNRLEEQAAVPMFGEHPVELGLKKDDGWLASLRPDPTYQALFRRAYPEQENAVTRDNVLKAIACFERGIISARSPYDRYHYGGEDGAVSGAAKRGEILFFSQPLSCFRCHGGFNFSDATTSARDPGREIPFHNTGLYNVSGAFSYPIPNLGIYEYTKRAADVGKFKAPSLRNIALTAPYMHDGSIPSLEGVLDHYAVGGRTIPAGEYAGVGHDNPNKDPLIGGFRLSPQDRQDLIAFLECLTDRAVLNDPKFSDPWK